MRRGREQGALAGRRSTEDGGNIHTRARGDADQLPGSSLPPLVPPMATAPCSKRARRMLRRLDAQTNETRGTVGRQARGGEKSTAGTHGLMRCAALPTLRSAATLLAAAFASGAVASTRPAHHTPQPTCFELSLAGVPRALQWRRLTSPWLPRE